MTDPDRMPEDRGPGSLEAAVVRLLRKYGLLDTSFRAPRDARKVTYGRGYPDWTIIGRRGMLFLELKAEDGVLSPQQQAFAFVIRFVADGKLVRYQVGRPTDLLCGEIEAWIRGVA